MSIKSVNRLIAQSLSKGRVENFVTPKELGNILSEAKKGRLTKGELAAITAFARSTATSYVEQGPFERIRGRKNSEPTMSLKSGLQVVDFLTQNGVVVDW
jgi:hypothetical protein